VVEIEFLDPGPEQAAPDEPAARRDARLRLAGAAPLGTVARLAAPLLLAGAAALLVAAPFRSVYTLHASEGTGPGAGLSVDGWGRYSGVFESSGFNGPRYGILLVACAGLLAVAAAVLLAHLLARPHILLPRAAVLLGLAGSAAGGAVAGALYLAFSSTRAGYQAQARQAANSAADDLVSTLPKIDVQAGGCLWLCVAAAGCGLVGAAAALLSDGGPFAQLSDRGPSALPLVPAVPAGATADSGDDVL
jgi:hypothetical protein